LSLDLLIGARMYKCWNRVWFSTGAQNTEATQARHMS